MSDCVVVGNFSSNRKCGETEGAASADYCVVDKTTATLTLRVSLERT